MTLGLLYRGTELYKRVELQHSEADANEYLVVHREVQYVYTPFDPAAVIQCWREIFKRVPLMPCGNCGAVMFLSENFMQMPEWLCIQEFDKEHGRGAWKHLEAVSPLPQIPKE